MSYSEIPGKPGTALEILEFIDVYILVADVLHFIIVFKGKKDLFNNKNRLIIKFVHVSIVAKSTLHPGKTIVLACDKNLVNANETLFGPDLTVYFVRLTL